MQHHPYTPHKDHGPMLEHHKTTWHGITRLFIYGAAAVAVILVLMAIFLVKRFS